ncbi:MAG TPA: UDP binding domain-containing protein, partial [Acidimicrobiales bacterium]
VNIAFANEMADVARQLGVNVIEAIQAASTKPFGFMPFYPGPGVGGHCIPCDPHYLLWQLRAVRARPGLVDEAMAQIAARPRQVVARAGELLAEHGRTLAGARVLVVGVAYKPCVRDVRESPALEIIKELQERGAEVSFTDEYVDEIEVPTGSMHRVHDPANGEWDLAIVHTAHPDVDHDWLVKVPLVLDTTYRLASVDGAVL